MNKQAMEQRQHTIFAKVIKMNPPYDVEFNARINIAGVFDINSRKSAGNKKRA